MTLQEQFGALLMVGFAGAEMNADLAAHICNLRPAGLIFFKRNIIAPDQLARLTRNVQTLALREFGRPLLLAVDQEGGTVARMPPPFTQLPDAAILGGSGSESVSRYSKLTAREMLLVGLNMNLAPVLDVHSLASAGVMQQRSFGSDPHLVAQCGVAAITSTQDEQIVATAKHFPGLGRAQEDPHHDLPVISASREDLYHHDLIPFQVAIGAKVACIMTSHTLYPQLDPENPGTFSRTIISGLLRHELGFDGVVITDDLEMGAVARRYSLESAAIAALQAGADLLLACNNFDEMHRALKAIEFGVQRGLLDPQSLGHSLARVERLRTSYLQPLRLANSAAVVAHFAA